MSQRPARPFTEVERRAVYALLAVVLNSPQDWEGTFTARELAALGRAFDKLRGQSATQTSGVSLTGRPWGPVPKGRTQP